MQNRLKVFVLLTFLHCRKKRPFLSWNVLSALTQRETSHLCKSPSLPSGLRWPYWGAKVEENPSNRQGKSCFVPKAFLCVSFQHGFLFFDNISFSSLWLWVSEVKGFPRASCLGMRAQGLSASLPPGALPKYLLKTAPWDFSTKALRSPQSTFDLPSPAASTCCKCHPSEHEVPLPLSALSADGNVPSS